MALCGTVWYSLLTLLGLSIRPDVGTKCKGLTVTEGGFVSCFGGESQMDCKVFCDGEKQGKFTCTEGEWTPELPTCAKPIEGDQYLSPAPIDGDQDWPPAPSNDDQDWPPAPIDGDQDWPPSQRLPRRSLV